MKRWLLALCAVTALGGSWYLWRAYWRAEAPIPVGILHSKTGPLAISERSMIDAELMAIDEINQEGDLLGRTVKGVVTDGRSDPKVFAQEARRLIDQEKVAVILGCWASATRKSVKPIVEHAGHLLVYPNAYEGLEQSPRIVYIGAAPNQQVIPAVNSCREALKAQKFFLVGTDYNWPHCVNAIVKDQLKALGAKVAGEYYIGFGSTGPDVGEAIGAIKSVRPDVIISTVTGDTNAPFYHSIDRETQHTWRPVYVGKIRTDGQFDIVWKLDKPVRPVAYPVWRTRSEWDQYVQGLYRSWGENWFNPGSKGKRLGPSVQAHPSPPPVQLSNVVSARGSRRQLTSVSLDQATNRTQGREGPRLARKPPAEPRPTR